MKGIIIILSVLLVFCSCQDDETSFGVTMPKEKLYFEPAPGGAIMHYELPADDEILAIRVRYTNALGEEVLRTGSYACDSLHIVGFNEARTGVEAKVTLCNRSGLESEPVIVNFNTGDSGPIIFFKNVNVAPSWDGFSVSCNMPAHAKGLAHIFYLSEDSKTHQTDTILMKTFAFKEGEDIHYIRPKQQASKYSVFIRTEDFRGYVAKQDVWENIPAFKTEKIAGNSLEFLDPYNLSIEDETAKLGKQYLFDGNVKGVYGIQLQEHYTFLTKEHAIDKPFIIDIKEKKLLATLRIYCMLYFADLPKPSEGGYGSIWHFSYISKLPCELTCYASNDKDDDNSWKKIGYFSQDPDTHQDTEEADCWGIRCPLVVSHRLSSELEFNLAEPAYMSIDFPAKSEEYRYLKIVVNKAFKDYRTFNKWEDENITFHELEVYVKKD